MEHWINNRLTVDFLSEMTEGPEVDFLPVITAAGISVLRTNEGDGGCAGELLDDDGILFLQRMRLGLTGTGIPPEVLGVLGDSFRTSGLVSCARMEVVRGGVNIFFPDSGRISFRRLLCSGSGGVGDRMLPGSRFRGLADRSRIPEVDASSADGFFHLTGGRWRTPLSSGCVSTLRPGRKIFDPSLLVAGSAGIAGGGDSGSCGPVPGLTNSIRPFSTQMLTGCRKPDKRWIPELMRGIWLLDRIVNDGELGAEEDDGPEVSATAGIPSRRGLRMPESSG